MCRGLLAATALTLPPTQESTVTLYRYTLLCRIAEPTPLAWLPALQLCWRWRGMRRSTAAGSRPSSSKHLGRAGAGVRTALRQLGCTCPLLALQLVADAYCGELAAQTCHRTPPPCRPLCSYGLHLRYMAVHVFKEVARRRKDEMLNMAQSCRRICTHRAGLQRLAVHK